MEYFLTLVVAGIALIYSIQRWIKVNQRRLPYPPGPPGDPIIGNFRQLPQVALWRTYAAWKKDYGDVISVGVLGSRIVIVNSTRAAFEIFDKRGSIYSERPHNVMLHDLMKSESLILMPYNERLRLHRKTLNAALNPTPVVDYMPIQERESYAFLGRLLNNPENFYTQTRRTTGAIILHIGYGHSVTTDDDYYVQLAEASVRNFRKAIQPTSFVVNLIPALKHVPSWMPFTGFHRFASEGRQLSTDLREKPFEMLKSRMMEGTAPMSYVSKLLEAKGSIVKQEGEEELLIKSTAAILYGAGTESTMSAVATFILAMVLHPDVQRKAQAEIDGVTGNCRLPTFADKTSLPYLSCVVSEVLRWQPVAPLGVPHAAKQDDVYEGYFIPKGTVVTGNIWAMAHDEALYEEPMKFWPERFDGRFPNIKDPRQYVFGFGRRLCPGRHLAINSIFITLACLLSAFDLCKARDTEGNEIEPLVDYSRPGPPQPFKCQITPRSKEAVSLIETTLTAYES